MMHHRHREVHARHGIKHWRETLMDATPSHDGRDTMVSCTGHLRLASAHTRHRAVVQLSPNNRVGSAKGDSEPIQPRRSAEGDSKRMLRSLRYDVWAVDEYTFEELIWIAGDDALRARATAIAERLGRDPDDIYRALRQLLRSPAERLRLGLRHGRLHPDRRGAGPPRGA